MFIDRTLAVTRAATIKGRDYWNTLRGDRPMPARAEILPREMRDFLPYIGLLDIVAEPDGSFSYTMRVAGGKIEEVFGSLTGQPIAKSLPQETAARWKLVFEEVRRTGAPLVVTGRVAYENLRHLKYELFIGPLGEDGAVRSIFGVLDIWPVM